jgi:protein SCO1/2
LTVALQDQGGNSATFGDYFTGRPSIVVYFYTRSGSRTNAVSAIPVSPGCSTSLPARLDSYVKTAAITYDPAFELAAPLKGYGLARGVTFDEHDRFFRTSTALIDSASTLSLA